MDIVKVVYYLIVDHYSTSATFFKNYVFSMQNFTSKASSSLEPIRDLNLNS